MVAVPTWDLFLILFFIIGVAYGFILQRDKTVITLISVYVALVITQVLTLPIQEFFAGPIIIFRRVYILLWHQHRIGQKALRRFI